MKRYEPDEYTRGDTRRRPDPRDDRHGRARVEPRDRREREVVDDRMDMRQVRVDPRDRMDAVMDPRIPAARMDPRANAAARLEPRRDQYGVEPRARGEPELYKDPRTGQLRDVRTGELYQEVARPQRGAYDDPMDRDLRMDQDDVPPPGRIEEIVRWLTLLPEEPMMIIMTTIQEALNTMTTLSLVLDLIVK